MHLTAVGTTFYGVFSANNTPDTANFPEGVTYLRNHNFTTNRLLALDGATEVPISIDPFFFKHTELAITRLTRLTALTRFTRLTQLTRLTRLTQLTRLTPLTRLTQLTRLTRLTSLTRFTPLTRLTRLTRFTPFTPFTLPPPIEPPGVAPFIRFGNTIFAPEDLALSRFEPLAGTVHELETVGITGLHQLVTLDPGVLVSLLGYSHGDASRLIELAQAALRQASR